MSELAFQTAFARLLIDGELRSTALAGGSLGGPGVELSEADAARLRELDRERVEVYAELLVMNRLAKAVEALPFTTKALGAQLWPLTLAWNRACPPVQAKKYDEAMAFGRYVQATLGSRPDDPSYLHDVLLYEMSRLELRYTTVHTSPSTVKEESLASIAALARACRPAGAGATDIYPRQVSHARMLAFDHDIESIIAELEQGRVPTAAEPCPSHVLMVADGTGRVHQFAANLPTAAFVSAATGARSFADVLAWLAEVFQQEPAEAFQALAASCVELCTSLVEQGVIVLSDRPVGRDAERVLH